MPGCAAAPAMPEWVMAGPTLIFRTEPRAGDGEALRAIAAATGVFAASELDFVPDIIATMLKDGDKSGYWLLVAEEHGTPLAFAIFGTIPGTENRFDLYWIATSPMAQGKGLARRLMDETRARARALGATHLFIQTSTRGDYAAARTLYERCGFPLIATVPDYYRDDDGLAIFGARL